MVVADSGPLHYLILIEHTHLLPALYGQVTIPRAVEQELTTPAAPQNVRVWLSNSPAWLSVMAPGSELAIPIDDRLDLGEREAIALAKTLQADLLLIDERAGRAEAKRLGLRVTGTVGVLRAAAEAHLASPREVIQRLRQTSFYVDEALLQAAFQGLES